ncbi:MAG: hypothetical protein U1F24_04150 [Alphaproteobacteria bacterium]
MGGPRLLGLIVLAAGAGSYLLFINPSVSTTLNKQTFWMLTMNPELLTRLGAIEGTILDFHSKLSDRSWGTKAKATRELQDNLAQFRAYGPATLTGQDKLTWQVMTWLYEDVLAFDAVPWLSPGSMLGSGTAYPSTRCSANRAAFRASCSRSTSSSTPRRRATMSAA